MSRMRPPNLFQILQSDNANSADIAFGDLHSSGFRRIADAMPHTFAVYDSGRRFLFVNRTGLERSGKTAAELLGKRDDEVFPPEVTRGYLPLLQRALATGTEQKGEFEVQLPDQDAPLIFEVVYSPLRTDANDAKLFVAAYTFDVTAYRLQQRAEQERSASLARSLERRNRRLRESARRLRAETRERVRAERASRKHARLLELLARNAADLFSLHDSAGRYLYASGASADLLGLPPEELIGHSAYEFFHPEDIPTIQASHESLLARGESAVVYRLRRRDGSWVWVETISREESLQNLQGLALPDARAPEGDGESRAPQHETTVLVCVTRNVQQRREREERIQNLNEELTGRARELEAVNRELESFSYSVSHDLRSPLRSLEGFSAALLEDYADALDATGRDYLQRIQKGATRMSHVIEDLLAMARVARHELQFRPVRLDHIAQSLLEVLQAREPERSVVARIEAMPAVFGDPQLLELMLQNLLENAWKFTAPRKTAHITLRAYVLPRSNRLRIALIDNGVGFDPQFVHKLFQPFQRLHNQKEFDGTGVGLATVRRIVRRHDGEVSIHGAPDRGAFVRLTLPLAEAALATEESGWNA